MEYSYFVNEMAKNRKKYATLELAMDVTLKGMSKEYSIYELLMKERGAVMSILETEYNEKAYGKTRYEEGLEHGKQSEKIATILRMIAKNVPIELIAEYTDTFVQEITGLLDYNK